MKKTMITMAICLAITTLTHVMAQEKHHTKISSAQLSDYSKLSLIGPLNVEWILADSNIVDIRLSDVDMPYLKCGVEQDQLTISLKPRLGKSKTDQQKGEVKIYTSHAVPIITVMGSTLLMPNTYSRSARTINVGGGGKVSGQLDCMDMELNVSGNSAVVFTGKSKYLTVNASENSKVNCRNLECTSIVANASTSSELFIWGAERVVLKASSGGTIFYRGHPNVVKETIPSFSLGASINNIKE
ncbi:hypothetical protein FACS1894159_04900 [Bacteroidia bacterium]|nr:hypothetical protein FACS1894159_04900 [Bacteroidia bacterium]